MSSSTSPYAAVHASPNGPGDARPTALQIIADANAANTLAGKSIVITGTSGGIGVETARALAQTGAFLFCTARDVAKAEKALSGVVPESQRQIVHMDQTSLESVREAAKVILEKIKEKGGLHALVCNAGVMMNPKLSLTKEGFEMQFGTNHVSHFLFFQLLKPALLESASADLPSRVVVVSSSAHNLAGLNASDNYNFQKGDYNPYTSYGQSKTANVYMANEIERRFGSSNLHATSLHPGIIATELTRHMDPEAFKGMEAMYPVMKSIEQGAATTVWATVAKEWKNKGGVYLNDCGVPGESKEEDDKIVGPGYAKWAFDVEEAKRLWRGSLKMVGLPSEE